MPPQRRVQTDVDDIDAIETATILPRVILPGIAVQLTAKSVIYRWVICLPQFDLLYAPGAAYDYSV